MYYKRWIHLDNVSISALKSPEETNLGMSHFSADGLCVLTANCV